MEMKTTAQVILPFYIILIEVITLTFVCFPSHIRILS